MENTLIAPPGLTAHPAAAVWPPLEPDVRAALKASIEKHGVRDAIDVLGTQVVDGNHRYDIAQELGKACPMRDLPEGTDPAKWSVMRNCARRHVGVDSLVLRAELALEAMGYNPPFGARVHGKVDPTFPHTNAEVGALVGCSPSTVRDARERRYLSIHGVPPQVDPPPQRERPPAPPSGPAEPLPPRAKPPSPPRAPIEDVTGPGGGALFSSPKPEEPGPGADSGEEVRRRAAWLEDRLRAQCETVDQMRKDAFLAERRAHYLELWLQYLGHTVPHEQGELERQVGLARRAAGREAD